MGNDFVVDNSVVMTWCFKDENSQYSDFILDKLEYNTAFVPSIWALEATNVLVVGERKKRINEAGSTRFMALLIVFFNIISNYIIWLTEPFLSCSPLPQSYL